MIGKMAWRAYLACFLMLMMLTTAFAYLDPGTVSYIISMVAGLFIAGGAALAIFRRKIKLFFQNLGKKKEAAAETVQQDDLGDAFDPMEEIDPLRDDSEDN